MFFAKRLSPHRFPLYRCHLLQLAPSVIQISGLTAFYSCHRSSFNPWLTTSLPFDRSIDNAHLRPPPSLGKLKSRYVASLACTSVYQPRLPHRLSQPAPHPPQSCEVLFSIRSPTISNIILTQIPARIPLSQLNRNPSRYILFQGDCDLGMERPGCEEGASVPEGYEGG